MHFILPKNYVNNKALSAYVDTSGQNSNSANSKLSPLSLAAIIVLAKLDISPEIYASISNNQNLAALILGKYFTAKDDKSLKFNLLKVLKDQIYKNAIGNEKNMRVNKISSSEKIALLISYGVQENIEEACENEQLIGLLLSNETLALKKTAIVLSDLSVLEDNLITILKNNTELLPHIIQHYQQEQGSKIINALLIPFNLKNIMNKLRQATHSESVFQISRNRALLKALELSPSTSHTKALMFLFQQNKNINKNDINQLNSFRVDAINFLISHNLGSLYQFALQCDNSIIFHGIETLINSKLMLDADDIILPQLTSLLNSSLHRELIKDNPFLEKVCIIYHLFKNTINTNKLMVNKLFLSDDTTNNLFNYLQNTSKPLSLIRKILTEDNALNAFIFLSEKKHDLNYIASQLQSNISIRQINDKLTLPPLSTKHMLKQLNIVKPMNSPTNYLKLEPLYIVELRAMSSPSKHLKAKPLNIGEAKKRGAIQNQVVSSLYRH